MLGAKVLRMFNRCQMVVRKIPYGSKRVAASRPHSNQSEMPMATCAVAMFFQVAKGVILVNDAVNDGWRSLMIDNVSWWFILAYHIICWFQPSPNKLVKNAALHPKHAWKQPRSLPQTCLRNPPKDREFQVSQNNQLGGAITWNHQQNLLPSGYD